jgi:hypothetical protein
LVYVAAMRLVLLLPGTDLDSPYGHYSPRVLHRTDTRDALVQWVEHLQQQDLAPYPEARAYLKSTLENLETDPDQFVVITETYRCTEGVVIEINYRDNEPSFFLALLDTPLKSEKVEQALLRSIPYLAHIKIPGQPGT